MAKIKKKGLRLQGKAQLDLSITVFDLFETWLRLALDSPETYLRPG
jgi:hypothetical protein